MSSLGGKTVLSGPTRTVKSTTSTRAPSGLLRKFNYKTCLLLVGTALYLPVWVHSHWKTYTHYLVPSSSTSGSGSGIGSQFDFFLAGLANHRGQRQQQQHQQYRTNGMTSADTNIINVNNNNNDKDITSLKEQVSALQEKMQYMESKVNSYLAFASDPFLSQKKATKCMNQKGIKEIGCPDKTKPCELDNQIVCLDNFPTPTIPQPESSTLSSSSSSSSCLVYDFGIRESPEFGLAFSGGPYHCDVVGFDPSPITQEWWKRRGPTIQQQYPTYRFVPSGAAGHDGVTRLLEYDWGQVSIIEFPTRVVDTKNCTATGQCRFKLHPPQRSFTIPVRTLSTFVHDLGHTHRRITLLKLDVEGSEYSLLEQLLEHDIPLCRRIDQLTLEWHHYDFDARYGITSNPQLNMIVHLLDVRCGLQQFWVHESHGWPSNVKTYTEMGMTLYYTLGSFKRTKWWNDDGVIVSEREFNQQ
jgi:hypothetical protein